MPDPTKAVKKTTALYLLPVSLWIAAFSFAILAQLKGNQAFNYSYHTLSENCIVSFWFVGNFFLFYAYLVPNYLDKRKIKLFALFTLTFILVSPVIIVLALKLNYELFSIPGSNKITVWGFLGGVFGSCITGSLGASSRIAVNWFRDKHKRLELENKNLISELNLIKAKLNPHFLFNTINNIDALIEEDPGKASVLLSKLSNLLRYVLYETDTEQIELIQEIGIIEKYIALQRIRISNPENIHLDVTMDEPHCPILPMLFIPFIENAFKHSDLNKPDQHISIELDCHKNALNFTCKNSFIPHEKTEGIGLELIRKRLELCYPDSFSLEINENASMYEVNLLLRLHEN